MGYIYGILTFKNKIAPADMNKKRHSLRTCLYNILDLYNTLRFDLYNILDASNS